MEYYTHKRVRDNIIKITDITNVNMFLVCGEKKAVLIDTGNGIGDIGAYVRELTDLPIEVVLTHGHVDHCGGASCFDTVYLNPKDWDVAKLHGEIEERKRYVGFCLFNKTKEELDKIPYVPKREKPYLPIEENQTWDLGGISVKAIPLAGHTLGMMAMLIPEERILLSGDGCNQFTLIVGEGSTTIEDYKESLLHIKKIESMYDTIWLSHGPTDEVPKSIIDDNIELCGEIMEGTTDNIPVKFLDLDTLLAKKTNISFARIDGKVGNIAFSKEQIFKGK